MLYLSPRLVVFSLCSLQLFQRRGEGVREYITPSTPLNPVILHLLPNLQSKGSLTMQSSLLCAHPSRCNSKNRHNLPIQQSHSNFGTIYAILIFFITWNVLSLCKEFLKVTVSLSCDGAKFSWVHTTFWDLFVQTGKFMIFLIFLYFFVHFYILCVDLKVFFAHIPA